MLSVDDVEFAGRKDTHDGKVFLAVTIYGTGGDAQRLSRPRAACVLVLVLAQKFPL